MTTTTTILLTTTRSPDAQTLTIIKPPPNPQIQELRKRIGELKDRKAVYIERLTECNLALDAIYTNIGALKDEIQRVGFDLGNVKADLGVNRDKMYTLKQAKMEKEAKAQFADLVESLEDEVDRLYKLRDKLRADLDTLRESIPAAKESIRLAHIDVRDIKYEINRAYEELNKIEPPKTTVIRGDGNGNNWRSRDPMEQVEKRRKHGKPPGGSRKCRKGH